MTGRAISDEQKKHLMDRLLDAWKKAPELRLGQLLYCVTGCSHRDGSLFGIEDLDLVRSTEQWVKETPEQHGL